MFEGIFVRQKMSLLPSINNSNQTGDSYLSRYVRRGRKRRSKESASCWNLSETANLDRTVRLLRVLKTGAETIKVSFEIEESSAPEQVRHGFLSLHHFDILNGNFCSCCAMTARLRNGALELRKFQKIVPKMMYLSLVAQMSCGVSVQSNREENDARFSLKAFSRVEQFHPQPAGNTRKTVRSHKAASWSASGVHTQTTLTTLKDCLRTV